MLEEAWRSEPFRAAARRVLLEPLKERPLLQFLLALLVALNQDRLHAAGTSPEEAAQWLAEYGGSPAGVGEAFAELAGRGLVQRTPDGRYVVAVSGVGQLAATLHTDLDAMLERAAARLRGGTPP
jgi:hypothetical protein